MVFTAGVLLFNHVLTFKGHLPSMTPKLYQAFMNIGESLSKIEDVEAKKALLLAMNRSLYKNQAMLDKLGDMTEGLVAKMQKLASEQADIKPAIEDLLKMLGA